MAHTHAANGAGNSIVHFVGSGGNISYTAGNTMIGMTNVASTGTGTTNMNPYRTVNYVLKT